VGLADAVNTPPTPPPSPPAPTAGHHRDNADGWRIGWGEQLDIRVVAAIDGEITDERVARYVAKYATKPPRSPATPRHGSTMRPWTGTPTLTAVTPNGSGLVFTSLTGTELDAANVRRAFRRVVRAAGLDPGEWSPRELRHSFVSLLSDGCLDRGHRRSLRAIGDVGDREDLPAPTAAGAPYRRGPDEPDLPGGVGGVVTQRRKEAMILDGSWPLTWWAILGLNQ
jgi:hypothetical protein